MFCSPIQTLKENTASYDAGGVHDGDAEKRAFTDSTKKTLAGFKQRLDALKKAKGVDAAGAVLAHLQRYLEEEAAKTEPPTGAAAAQCPYIRDLATSIFAIKVYNIYVYTLLTYLFFCCSQTFVVLLPKNNECAHKYILAKNMFCGWQTCVSKQKHVLLSQKQ